MADTLTATDWVITQMKADATLHAIIADRVYLDQIPPQITEVFPYAVVSKVPQEPVTNNMGDIVMFDDLVQVDFYDKGSDITNVAAALNQVITVLHKKSGSTATGTVLGCVFAGEVGVPAEVDGMTVYSRRTCEFEVYTQ